MRTQDERAARIASGGVGALRTQAGVYLAVMAARLIGRYSMDTNKTHRPAVTRRTALTWLAGGFAGLTTSAWAQQKGAEGAPYATLKGEHFHELAPHQTGMWQMQSPAPRGPAGRWERRAALPLPRSEMAWATAMNDRMHVIGGYGEGAVSRAYHHVYDPRADRWSVLAPLPRGANHVAVVADGNSLYALGGFINQNRTPDDNAFVYDGREDRWRAIARLSRERGGGSAVVLAGKVHLIGGAALPTDERASVGWHEVYDAAADRWEMRKALPAARDHAGAVTFDGRIHVIGGRFNTFEYNTALHHVYHPDRDTWSTAAPIPTARSGHGLVVYRNRFFAMGGEQRDFDPKWKQIDKVLGQLESYDPRTDQWQSHAPMMTPRHGLGAAVLGDWIHVAGGGPVVGGSMQSSIHEAFTLG